MVPFISLGEELKYFECVPQHTRQDKVKESLQVTPCRLPFLDAATSVGEALLPEGSVQPVTDPKPCIVQVICRDGIVPSSARRLPPLVVGISPHIFFANLWREEKEKISRVRNKSDSREDLE